MMQNIACGRPYTLFPDPNYSCNGIAICDKESGENGWVCSGQLTDGKRYATASPNPPPSTSLWCQEKYAVAWVGIGSCFVAITVALESEKSIEGVAYSTAAGKAGVEFPEAIYLLVSDNGTDFFTVGDLISLSDKPVPNPNGQLFTFEAKKLKTRGKYVRFVVIPAGINKLDNGDDKLPSGGCDSVKYTVVDEIEIYSSNSSSTLSKPPSHPLSNPFTTIPSGMTMVGINRRLRNDLLEVRKRIADLNKTAQYESQLLKLQAEIDALQYGPIATPVIENGITVNKITFEATVPFNAVHKKIFALFAQVLKDEGHPDLIVWGQHRYAYHTPLDVPSSNCQPADIEIVQMRNEYRAEVLNLTNATQNDTVARFQIQGLPDSTSYIDVFQVDWRDTFWGTLPALPFRKLKSDNSGVYKVQIPSGMTRQIWFSIKPPKTMSPKPYEGRIKLDTTGGYCASVPFVLNLCQEIFPDVVDLNYGVYDYASPPIVGAGNFSVYDTINVNNREAVVDDLKRHLVNVPTAASGKLSAYLKDWIREWPEAHYYYIFLNVPKPKSGEQVVKCEVGVDNEGRSGSDLEVWARKKARDIRRTFKRLRKGQIVFHLVDEPRCLGTNNYVDVDMTVKLFSCIRTLIRTIRSGTDHFSHFINLGGNLGHYPGGEESNIWKTDSSEALAIYKAGKRALDVADIVIPHITQIHNGGAEALKFYRQLAAAGKQFWLYATPWLWYDDPSVIYRLQPWHCFIYGATGYMFWAYCDGVRWDETTKGREDFLPTSDPAIQSKREKMQENWNAIRNQYPMRYKRKRDGLWERTSSGEYVPVYGTHSPVYLDEDNAVTITKYWEAAREGVEDYQYFFMLRNRIQRTLKRHPKNPDALGAMRFLRSLRKRYVLKVACMSQIMGIDAHGKNVRSVWNDTRDPNLLDEARREALLWLERLRPLAD